VVRLLLAFWRHLSPAFTGMQMGLRGNVVQTFSRVTATIAQIPRAHWCLTSLDFEPRWGKFLSGKYVLQQ
jgi:hypothetical protein